MLLSALLPQLTVNVAWQDLLPQHLLFCGLTLETHESLKQSAVSYGKRARNCCLVIPRAWNYVKPYFCVLSAFTWRGWTCIFHFRRERGKHGIFEVMFIRFAHVIKIRAPLFPQCVKNYSTNLSESAWSYPLALNDPLPTKAKLLSLVTSALDPLYMQHVRLAGRFMLWMRIKRSIALPASSASCRHPSNFVFSAHSEEESIRFRAKLEVYLRRYLMRVSIEVWTWDWEDKTVGEKERKQRVRVRKMTRRSEGCQESSTQILKVDS